MLKKLNDSIKEIKFTVSGGFALLFLLLIVYNIIVFLLSFVGMHIEWFKGTLTTDDYFTLALYYLFFFTLIYMAKTTTVTKHSDSE